MTGILTFYDTIKFVVLLISREKNEFLTYYRKRRPLSFKFHKKNPSAEEKVQNFLIDIELEGRRFIKRMKRKDLLCIVNSLLKNMVAISCGFNT